MASKDNKRPVMERRDFKLDLAKCEVRSADGDQPAAFNGYAAVFDSLSVNLGGFRERIQPGAFRSALEEGDDVRFLINHDANLILGRSTAGTISLSEDEIGLRVECELPNTTYANDLVESMKRGDIDAMSFGFTTESDAWKEKDPETGLPIRELLGARLFDVSVVCYPAYEETAASVRSFIEEETPELLERAQKAAEELNDVETEAREEPAAEPVEREDAADEKELAEKTREAFEAFEALRAEAGISIDENNDQCEGVAVVWNWNGEMQSCHSDRAAAEAQVEALTSGAAGAAREAERVGKVLSTDNADKLTQAQQLLHAVLSAAGAVDQSADDAAGTASSDPNEILYEHKPEDGETREELVFPSIEAFAAAAAERGWSYDDDWAIWSLTSMIESASCFLLYAGGQADYDDDAAEDAPQAAAMKEIIASLTSLLAEIVASAASRDAEPAEERDAETIARERERQRLSLLEHELV